MCKVCEVLWDVINADKCEFILLFWSNLNWKGVKGFGSVETWCEDQGWISHDISEMGTGLMGH